MVRVTFVDAGGTEYGVDAPVGSTLMEAAIANEIPGIVGFCGGMCSCGTCHCYPAGAIAGLLEPPDDNELDTLARVLDRRPASRLGCQLALLDPLNGLRVEIPSRQRVP